MPRKEERVTLGLSNAYKSENHFGFDDHWESIKNHSWNSKINNTFHLFDTHFFCRYFDNDPNFVNARQTADIQRRLVSRLINFLSYFSKDNNGKILKMQTSDTENTSITVAQ